jgi:hypothetical protein
MTNEELKDWIRIYALETDMQLILSRFLQLIRLGSLKRFDSR